MTEKPSKLEEMGFNTQYFLELVTQELSGDCPDDLEVFIWEELRKRPKALTALFIRCYMQYVGLQEDQIAVSSDDPTDDRWAGFA